MVDEPRTSGRPKSYPLTQAEREYLRSDELGSYREAELQRRVRNKAKLIPERLDRLLDDVELLAENDELNSLLWSSLLASNSTEQEDLSPYQLTTGIIPSSPTMNVGRLFGKLLFQIQTSVAGEEEWERRFAHIMAGVLGGFYIDTMPARSIDEMGYPEAHQSIYELMEPLISEVEERRRPTSEVWGGMRERMEQQKVFQAELDTHLRSILSDAGYQVSELSSLKEILEEEDNGTNMESVEEEWPTDFAFSLLDRLRGHLVVQEFDLDGVPGTYAGSLSMAPIEFEKVEPSDIAPKERVLEVMEDCRIEARTDLESRARSEKDDVLDVHWRGVDADQVMEKVREMNEPSSREIARELHQHKDYTGPVTRVARVLAGCEYSKTTHKVPTPILEGDSEAWSFTPFGEAFYFYNIEIDPWSIDFLPDDVVNAAIDWLKDSP